MLSTVEQSYHDVEMSVMMMSQTAKATDQNMIFQINEIIMKADSRLQLWQYCRSLLQFLWLIRERCFLKCKTGSISFYKAVVLKLWE